jgi:hypothetical protein
MVIGALYGSIIGAVIVPFAAALGHVSLTKTRSLRAIVFTTVAAWVGSAIVFLQTRQVEQLFEWRGRFGIPNPIILVLAVLGLLLALWSRKAK